MMMMHADSHDKLWLVPIILLLIGGGWSTLGFQAQPSHTTTSNIQESDVSKTTRASAALVHRPSVTTTGLHRSVTNNNSLQQHLSLFLLTKNISGEGQGGEDNDNNSNSGEKIWNINSLKKKKSDEVVRVIDANTVKLRRNGLVTFAAIQTPSGYNDKNFRFPDCMTKSPSAKVRQLLPKDTKVFVIFTENEVGSRPRGALVEVQTKKILVNTELVREGFAKPVGRGRIKTEEILPGITDELSRLQVDAQRKGLGIFKMCDDKEIASDYQFEPLDVTTEIQWGDDGGKVMLKQTDKRPFIPPRNPGDIRGCSDFKTYEDALRWYEKFVPYYGDVAKLDRDGDGVPCSGLPHTQDSVKYRIKKPSSLGKSLVVQVE